MCVQRTYNSQPRTLDHGYVVGTVIAQCGNAILHIKLLYEFIRGDFNAKNGDTLPCSCCCSPGQGPSARLGMRKREGLGTWTRHNLKPRSPERKTFCPFSRNPARPPDFGSEFGPSQPQLLWEEHCSNGSYSIVPDPVEGALWVENCGLIGSRTFCSLENQGMVDPLKKDATAGGMKPRKMSSLQEMLPQHPCPGGARAHTHTHTQNKQNTIHKGSSSATKTDAEGWRPTTTKKTTNNSQLPLGEPTVEVSWWTCQIWDMNLLRGCPNSALWGFWVSTRSLRSNRLRNEENQNAKTKWGSQEIWQPPIQIAPAPNLESLTNIKEKGGVL